MHTHVSSVTCETTVAHATRLAIARCAGAVHATLLASKCCLHSQHVDVTRQQNGLYLGEDELHTHAS